MKHTKKTIASLLLGLVLLCLLPSCGSTRSENGVTIKEEGSYNFLPW